MKVRIAYTVDISDEIRAEINAHYDRPGLASREEVRWWYKTFGSSMDDDLSWAADQHDDDDETQS